MQTATHTTTTSGSHNVQVQSQVHTATQVPTHVPQRYHTVAHSVSQSQAPRSMARCLLMSRTPSRSCWRTATGPSYTVAWSRTVPRVPPHTLPHGSPLLTGLLLRPRHSSLCAEADRAGPGARSRGADRAHKGAAAERLRAGASGRWSPALDLSGAGHSGNAHRGAAFRGQKSLQDSVPSQVFKSRTHSGCAGAACSGGSLARSGGGRMLDHACAVRTGGYAGQSHQNKDRSLSDSGPTLLALPFLFVTFPSVVPFLSFLFAIVAFVCLFS